MVDGTVNPTPGNLLKLLHPEARIEHLVRFLNDLKAALQVSTSDANKQVWVPDQGQTLEHPNQILLTYDYRQSTDPTANTNRQYLYFTDIAALSDQITSWLKNRSTNLAGTSIPDVYGLIQDIKDNELMDRAAEGGGYDEKKLQPAAFSLVPTDSAYTRLVEIVDLLWLAALAFEKQVYGQNSIKITSLVPLSEYVEGTKPAVSWPTIKQIATILAEAT